MEEWKRERERESGKVGGLIITMNQRKPVCQLLSYMDELAVQEVQIHLAVYVNERHKTKRSHENNTT